MTFNWVQQSQVMTAPHFVLLPQTLRLSGLNLILKDFKLFGKLLILNKEETCDVLLRNSLTIEMLTHLDS